MTRIALVFGVTLSLWASAALAENFTVGSIQIGNPWTRATPKGSMVAGGYMTITNKGAAPDRLVGGSTSAAGRFEVHRMAMENGVMKMRPVEGGLEIKPGETVELKPGSFHVMLMGPEAAAGKRPEGQRHAHLREGRQGRHRIRGRGDRRDARAEGRPRRALALTRQ